MTDYIKNYFSEFLTWVDIGRTKGILPKDTCDYGKLVSDFVSDSCVPGAHSDDHAITSGTDTEKLCSNCQSSNSQLSNIFFAYFIFPNLTNHFLQLQKIVTPILAIIITEVMEL